MISAIFFVFFVTLSLPLHTGPTEGLKLHSQKSSWVFYPGDVQTLNKDRTFYPQESYVFCILDFNGFWLENVTVLKANCKFPVMAQKLHDSGRNRPDKVKCEIRLEDIRLENLNFPCFIKQKAYDCLG